MPNTPIAQLLDPVVALIYLLCGLLVVAGAVAATLRRWGWNDAGLWALVTAFPNSGFMGVPLLVALLGQASAGPVIMTMALDMVVTTSLCIALSRLGLGNGSAGRALRLALKGVLINPLPWAIGLGALASATQFQLPGPVDKTIAMLADAASPVALFTIGAVLARSQMQPGSSSVAPRHYVPLALAKLLLHPAAGLGRLPGRRRPGRHLTPLTITALVLTAALPSASNVSLLAERFEAHGGRVARIILVSTALAFVSFSAAVAWLTGH